ncbi:50S ribosomal protein L11 methyltransferase [Altericista sp. CCNU0014]|uniref:50S ribosomal protein L11 methyltransferase n=1 Tax=Altericista sp. CCNU0014 TaxID=3082949 RepID=UPI00384AACFB
MTENYWWALQILSEPASDELLSWALQAQGCQGTASQIEGGQLKICGYFAQSQVSEARLAEMAQYFKQVAADANLSLSEVSWSAIREEDWASSWKDYWHPTEVGDRLLIHPDWLPVPATDRIVLRLNPGVAFGTGAHATTQLCLVALEQQLAQPSAHPPTVADIGCGTGILAIAALQLGAGRAFAVDTDPLAVQAARECRDLNAIAPDRMVATEGSIETAIALAQEPVDGFCCNILAHVIIELVPQMKTLTKPQGWGILSGILQRQVPDVVEALTARGWQVVQRWQQEDWACLKIVRSD